MILQGFLLSAALPARSLPALEAQEQTGMPPVRQLKENFGVAVLLATEESLLDTGRISRYDLQKEFFKLRQQEFAPLRKANFGGLRTLGQELNVNDVPYFNFQSYIQWKLVSRRLYRDEERKDFNLAVGRRLLNRYLPDVAVKAFAICPKPAPASASLVASTQQQPLVALSPAQGASDVGQQTGTPGVPFTQLQEEKQRQKQQQKQVQLLRIAQGEKRQPFYFFRPMKGPSICYDGVQGAVTELLQKLYSINFVQEYSAEWANIEPRNEQNAVNSATLTVKLKGPADLQGGVLIRAEEDNFWQRISSSMLLALFQQLGVETSVDEYFFREMYKPKSLLEQAVLALGDPLVPAIDNVDVDEIVETWQLSWP